VTNAYATMKLQTMRTKVEKNKNLSTEVTNSQSMGLGKGDEHPAYVLYVL